MMLRRLVKVQVLETNIIVDLHNGKIVISTMIKVIAQYCRMICNSLLSTVYNCKEMLIMYASNIY